MENITVKLDSQVALAYSRANVKERKKANHLINLWLKNIFLSKKRQREKLFEIMEQSGRIAQSNGLTPQLLEQIFNEKD